jgi:hypothetical protein
MQLSQMRLEVRRAIDELTEDFWSDDEIDDWLNEGAKVMVSIASPLQSSYQFNTVAGTQEYVLPDDVDEVFAVAINYSGIRQLRPTLAERVQWSQSYTGIPAEFYTRYMSLKTAMHTSSGITVAAAGGTNVQKFVLGLYPIPSGANQVTISYYSKHFTMSADADIPQVPVEFHRGIINYAVHLAKEKDEAYAEADRHLEKFKNYCDRLRDKMISQGQEMAFPTVVVAEDLDSPAEGNIVVLPAPTS